MTMSKYIKKFKIIMSALFTGLAIFCVIYYSNECSRGIINGLSFCTQVLLPSLFLYMVISSYIVQNGIAEVIGKYLSKPTRFLFRLPGCCAIAVILSLIGGYPIGAKCVESLYNEKLISEKQAVKLSYFAVGAGPGFLLNYIGNALLNNKQAGNILLIAQTISLILTGIIVGRLVKSEDYNICSIKKQSGTGKNIIVDSVKSACAAALNMCAMVVVFSAIIEISDTLFINHPVISDLTAAALEVTTACNRMCGKYSLTLIAFIVGFGGLSVHFQIYSALKSIKTNKTLFFVFRILDGIISAIITYILLILFPSAVTVFATTTQRHGAGISSTIWGSAALIITAICFLGSINYTENKRR